MRRLLLTLLALGLFGTAARAQNQAGRALQINSVQQQQPENALVRVPDAPSLRPNEFTLEGYFRFENANNRQMLIIKPIEPNGQNNQLPSYASFMLFYNGVADSLVGRIGTENGFIDPAVKAFFSPTPGVFYHLAYTVDSPVAQTASFTIQKLYINGNLVATQVLPGGVSPRMDGSGGIARVAAAPRYGSSAVTVGAADSQGGLAARLEAGLPTDDGKATTPARVAAVKERFFNGTVDEIRIWGIALTEAQIQRSMNSTIEGAPPELLLNLRFDEDPQTGNQLRDESRYGNDGLVEGDFLRVPSAAPIDESLPVELIGFSANNRDGAVELAWRTGAERENLGFVVFRDGVEIASYRNVTGLRGAGTTAQAQSYSYRDGRVSPGATYRYTLRSVDLSGAIHDYDRAVTITAEAAAGAPTVPTEFTLLPASPNPFNPSTTLRFALPSPARVTIGLYDALGRAVRTPVSGEVLSASVHQVTVDGSGLPSGVYLVRVLAERTDGLGVYQDAQRIVLSK